MLVQAMGRALYTSSHLVLAAVMSVCQLLLGVTSGLSASKLREFTIRDTGSYAETFLLPIPDDFIFTDREDDYRTVKFEIPEVAGLRFYTVNGFSEQVFAKQRDQWLTDITMDKEVAVSANVVARCYGGVDLYSALAYDMKKAIADEIVDRFVGILCGRTLIENSDYKARTFWTYVRFKSVSKPRVQPLFNQIIKHVMSIQFSKSR